MLKVVKGKHHRNYSYKIWSKLTKRPKISNKMEKSLRKMGNKRNQKFRQRK